MYGDRRRLAWAFAASTVLNVLVWTLSSAHLPLLRVQTQSPRERIVISSTSIRIERRSVPQPRRTVVQEPPPLLAPPPPAALALPHGWARQDFGNIAETDTTIWLNWSKQTAKFVPRVFLWQKKADASYMHRPTLKDAVREVLTSLHADNAKIYVSRAERVCNGERDGWYLSYIKPDDDPPLRLEETIFMSGQTIFRATYIRPIDQPEDTETRKALNTLCT